MSEWAELLTIVYAGIAVIAVVMYVLLDGFDLGIGIMFPMFPDSIDRDTMMNTIAPVWDGNETWLILGGGVLFGAFPLAYSTILPGTYIPLIVMLIALIFRGVAFEFRFKARTSRWVWDRAFHLGSLFATIAQGYVLGAFIHGFTLDGRDFVGGPLDWFSPFSTMCAAALVFGYALLGSTWLVLKTEGELMEKARQYSKTLLWCVLLFIGIVSVWTPFLDNTINERWFSFPNMLYLSPVPLITAFAVYKLYEALNKGYETRPFVLTMSMFLLSFLGLGISLWPYVIPHEITIWQAAAPPETQEFLLVGMLVMVPAVLGYTAFTYYVFRGKVREGYGH